MTELDPNAGAASIDKPKRVRKPKDPNAPAPAPRVNKFAALYPSSATVTLLRDKNPKKAGSKAAARFEGYVNGGTVGQALANGVLYADIAYDVGHGHISISA